MPGTVVQVFFNPAHRPSEAIPFELVETEFQDFAEFLEAVEGNSLICVSRIITRRGAYQGERIVKERVPFAFRGIAVERAQLPTYRIVEDV